MPLPALSTLGAALLAGYRASATPPPAVPDPSDPVTVLRALIETGTGGAQAATDEHREQALRGLDALKIRHPVWLAKIADGAAKGETYVRNAVWTLAEYARTRRT